MNEAALKERLKTIATEKETTLHKGLEATTVRAIFGEAIRVAIPRQIYF